MDPACSSSGHAHSFLQDGFPAQDSEGSTPVLPVAYLPQVDHLHFTDSEIKAFSGEETDARTGSQQSKQDLAYLIFTFLWSLVL